MGWLQEFKTFIQRGNVIDLAVAVIIGSAFGKIVTSVVADIIMPVIGIMTRGINISGLSFTLDDAVLKYGAFLQAVIDFLIVAFCVFLIVKAINALNVQKLLAGEPKPAELTLQERLLTEIRDLLKAQQTPTTTTTNPPPDAIRPV
jgi:large conductance mechanosensitive channel